MHPGVRYADTPEDRLNHGSANTFPLAPGILTRESGCREGEQGTARAAKLTVSWLCSGLATVPSDLPGGNRAIEGVVPSLPAQNTGAKPRYTGAGTREIAILFGSQVVGLAVAVLVQSLLAYTLRIAGRGAAAICLQFGALACQVFAPGVASGARYCVMAKQMTVSQAVAAGTAIVLGASVAAIAVAVPLMLRGAAFFQQAPLESLLLCLVLVPLSPLVLLVRPQLTALRLFSANAMLNVLQPTMFLIGLAILVLHAGLGLNGVILAMAGTHVVSISISVGILCRRVGLTWERPRWASLKRIVSFGLGAYPEQIARLFQSVAGLFVLGSLAPAAEVSLFAAGSTLVHKLALIQQAAGPILQTRLMEIKEHDSELFGCCLRLVFWATLAAATVLAAISIPLIRILLSEAFLPAAPILWLMAPGEVAGACAGLLGTHFYNVGRPHIGSLAAVAGLAVDLCLLVLLYPALGFAAPALSFTAGQACRCAVLAFTYHRETHLSWYALWMPRRGDYTRAWAASRAALLRRVPSRSLVETY